MKTAKLVIGIISMVLFILIAFQSCAAGLGNALAENGETSGSAGFILALCMLVAGIIGVCARKSKAGGIVAGAFYLFGGLLGITNYGTYKDLIIWSVLCFAFGAFFVISSLLMKKPNIDTVSNENPKE